MSSRSVLMFCPQFRPVIGGAERQAERLAMALVAAGCRVRILTPRIDPHSPDFEETAGVQIERFPLIDLSRRWHLHGIALINIPFMLWQVIRAVRPRLKDADVLHAHLASLQTLGAILAARLSGVPALCKAAMADQRSDLGELEKQGAGGNLIAWLFRHALMCWVATTQSVAQALMNARVKAKQIHQIPNGINLSAIEHPRTTAVRRFLYLGRLSTNIQRDVPTLLKAFEHLLHALPEAELAVVGGGDLLDETRALAAEGIAGDRIHIPGFDFSEKWLEWADCFVLPSRREGLSNALLEAMAAGLPCIANDIPPNREVLADGAAGVLVPEGEVDKLVEAMLRMAMDAGHADTLRNAARERVARYYAIEAVAARYLDLYHRLLNNKGRRNA